MGLHRLNVIAAGICALGAAAAQVRATTYVGNGATGFGGPVGQGNLSVTQSGGNVTFTFDPPPAHPSLDGNSLVIYLATGAAGLTNTSSLTASGDGGNRGISGYNNGVDFANTGDTTPSRTLVTFAPGFQATYAFSFANDYDGLFKINTDGTLTYLTGANPQPAAANAPAGTGPTNTLTLPLSTFGLNQGDGISFVATDIDGRAAYRSNETIGSATADYASSNNQPAGSDLAGADNPGFNNGITFTSFDTFQTTPAPEPAALLGLSGAGVTLLRRRRPSPAVS